MPVFKSKAQKAEQARAANTQHDSNAVPQSSGVDANNYPQHNIDSNGHDNTNRDGGIGHQPHSYNDPNTVSQGTGFGANENAQHNTNAPGYNNAANSDGGYNAHNDPNTASPGTGIGANDYAQHNNNVPGHNNTANRESGVGYQGDRRQDTAPGTSHAADTGHHHHGHHGGPIDRAENAVGARAIRNQVGDKEQEVGAIKTQSAELTEAERLEHEAKMHRDRAVAGGAHPANHRLGAGGQT
ncbi:hypothetical protein FOMPIDRAFT_101712 [Fomitopsis schrenkii]|uniref:Uncharacterized protein n=1 Tax=Fomitopsis schrenkii TaxID=2126942 RepID=S8DWU6_FOMSC|nr:hypothetical protein FOMPIDRAFT_101712 [Fomitopsis schrenkii]